MLEPPPDNNPSDLPACPDCGGPGVQAATAMSNIARCQECGREFFAENGPVDPDESEPKTPSGGIESEFDRIRIRQLSSMRRAIYRSRSHVLIASSVCVAAAAQCVYLAVRGVQAGGWSLAPVLLLLPVLPALIGAGFFARRAMAFHREARLTAQADPATPPDFSTLADGSQRASNLENIR